MDKVIDNKITPPAKEEVSYNVPIFEYIDQETYEKLLSKLNHGWQSGKRKDKKTD
jgi:predicted DNA-binding ArsR family transcriptional regulator